MDSSGLRGHGIEQRALALFDAALDHDPAELPAWLDAQCAGDAALRERVEALLRADAQGSRLLSAQDASSRDGGRLLPPPQVGPYRLDELIGSGGMGAVYRAHRNDGLFEQTVAIKFVRPFAERATAQALMDSERRLLARLQHPGIARILDGGATDGGLPFLVMEFVQGVPIDEHVRERALPVAARVALLAEVCAALADAHRHFVLHCDIKPANILIDADGRAKLIDFGIARLQGAVDPALPLGFTAAYASPQRRAGEPPTTADDVYALGLLLAELVTGRLPANASAIAAGDGLDEELAAVARRAADAQPQSRYAGVDGFADDLQRWLARRPVAALPPHWRYRTRKLVQRHPWRVAAGVLAATGLVVALGVITALYTRAEASRREAERRFTEVRSLANFLLFDFDARLEATPGTTALRRDLVERSQHYLDTLAAGAGQDLALQREVAVGLGRLAEVQGGWATPNVGERAAARATFERAEAMLARLVQQRGTDWRWRADLGRLQQRMADFYGGVDNDAKRQLEKAREAEAQVRQALAGATAAAVQPRELGDLHALLNAARLTQAFALDWTGGGESAITISRDEEARLQALPPELRAAMPFDFRSGRTAVQLGDSLFYLNRFDDALAAYRRAQQRYEAADAAQPNQRRVLDSLSLSLWGSSLSLTELGRHREALVDIDRGLAISGRLLALDPTNDNAQRQMLILRSDRALVLGRLGRVDEAIAEVEDGLRERQVRAARSPALSEPQRDALVPLHALAEMHWQRGDTSAGCAIARRAIDGWAEFGRRWPLTELDRQQAAEKEREAARRCP